MTDWPSCDPCRSHKPSLLIEKADPPLFLYVSDSLLNSSDVAAAMGFSKASIATTIPV